MTSLTVFVLLGTLFKFMIHAIKKKKKKSEVMTSCSTELFPLCIVWLRNWISHSALALQHCWADPTRELCSGWHDLPCTTAVTRSLTLRFPIQDWLQKCQARSSWGLSTGQHSTKFPFYHEAMPPLLAGPENKKEDSAFCLILALDTNALLMTLLMLIAYFCFPVDDSFIWAPRQCL